MQILQVRFVCETCRHYNRQYAGTKEFTHQEDEFESFSDVFNHMIVNRDHHVDIIVEEEREED